MMCLGANYKKKNMKTKYFFASLKSIRKESDPLVRVADPDLLLLLQNCIQRMFFRRKYVLIAKWVIFAKVL
jgi:hypothetical protein